MVKQIKTIDQIKDCQTIDLGYNSFRDLVLNPKKDMAINHLNWCIERSMKEYADQKTNGLIEVIEDFKPYLMNEQKRQVSELVNEIIKW